MGGFKDTLSYRTCIFYLIYILKIHVFRQLSSEETSYTVVYSEAGHFSLRHNYSDPLCKKQPYSRGK